MQNYLLKKLPKNLKLSQAKALFALSRHQHVGVSFATGYGKSFCYQLPAQLWGWRVLVVSPLTSLMQDQYNATQDIGINGIIFLTGQSAADRSYAEDHFWSGNWSICYISPERLNQWRHGPQFELLLNLKINLIALDEIHLSIEWRGFREDYNEIIDPIRRLVGGGSLLIGLTASLGKVSLKKLMSDFCDDAIIFAQPLGRNNLLIQPIPLHTQAQKFLVLTSLLSSLNGQGSAIIYCNTKLEVDNLSNWLRLYGVNNIPFHAALPAAYKRDYLKRFTTGESKIVVATKAFGLGIDYSNVRLVVHFSLPRDISSFWQEAGRAGRDSKSAIAVPLFCRSDIFEASKLVTHKDRREFYKMWITLLTNNCRKKAIAKFLLGYREKPCGQCLQCNPNAFDSNAQMQPLFLNVQFFLQKKVWWLEEEAKIFQWARRKIFYDYKKS